MTVCCPHPERVHELGVCRVIHCGCEVAVSLNRCRCPYRDCWIMVDTSSGLCPTCESVCVPAKQMEQP